jgi:hypothetical protein
MDLPAQAEVFGSAISRVLRKAVPFDSANPLKPALMVDLMPSAGDGRLAERVWNTLSTAFMTTPQSTPLVLVTGVSGVGKTKVAYDIGRHTFMVVSRVVEHDMLTPPPGLPLSHSRMREGLPIRVHAVLSQGQARTNVYVASTIYTTQWARRRLARAHCAVRRIAPPIVVSNRNLIVHASHHANIERITHNRLRQGTVILHPVSTSDLLVLRSGTQREPVTPDRMHLRAATRPCSTQIGRPPLPPPAPRTTLWTTLWWSPKNVAVHQHLGLAREQ